ncbi:hypothetical protein Taro_017599 [Colocasia esculenta]|uniref:Transmembrane protein n=1 Tax=Colocasia esculenta TaxID=4460 RepID=A0A843UGK3_COLES|nr:hypothetical protein [Colocasia esculenta]
MAAPVCAEVFASVCVDSACSAGVIFGLTRVVLELFEFIAYLTGLHSNPSGSSDSWVAVRPSGSLAGVREVGSLQWYQSSGVVSFQARSECELQESVAVVAWCACFERGGWFARAAVVFVVGLRIRVGLWSAELVEGVLALLAVPLLWGESLLDVPLLLGCVLVGCPLIIGVCVVLAVCLALCACAPLGAVLCSVDVIARAKQMLCVPCCTVGASLGCPMFWCGFPELLVVVLVRFALRTVPTCFCQFLCYLRVEDYSWHFGWWFPPKLPYVVLVVAALSVKMSCRCRRSVCPCCSLPGCCRSRCGASDRVSGRGAGQFVFLIIFWVSRLRWWDFVCPQDREVGFISRALWALSDGHLVSAMGVWLVVLLWKCQSRLVIFLCVWKRFVVRVSFPCFPLVARGGGAGRAFGAMSRTVVTFVAKVPPVVLSRG